jgi:hypothetical protein
MTKHRDSGCSNIRQLNKADQRVSRIDLKSLSSELTKFANKTYAFASIPEQNDIWLEIDLDDISFETAVADYVLKLIAQHYAPMRSVKPTTHC